MSKLKQVGCHIARWPCLFPLPWVPAVAARQLSHLSHASDSLLAPHRSPKRRNLSILEYAAGPGWPVLLTQLAQDFTWLGGNSSEHACITQRAKEGMRQGSMEHTLHHATPEHSMHAACIGQPLTTLTEPPAFFTPPLDSQDCAGCRPSGRQAGQWVLLLPMAGHAIGRWLPPAHSLSSHAEPYAMSGRKRVFSSGFVCMLLLHPLRRDDHVSLIVSYHKLVFLASTLGNFKKSSMLQPVCLIINSYAANIIVPTRDTDPVLLTLLCIVNWYMHACMHAYQY